MSIEFVIITSILAQFGGCGRSVHGELPPFEVARDPNQTLELRKRAAIKLDESNRRKLQSELISSLPGEWNRATADAIFILGEIGDEQAGEQIEGYKNTPLHISGQLHVFMDDALKKIHDRNR
jgi:hypothetical protein